MKKLLSLLTIVFFAAKLTASITIYEPNLISPTHNAINQMPNVLLNWSPVAGNIGLYYKVQLSTDSDFTNPTVFTTNLSAINTSELNFGSSYFWRVKAYEANDSSSWSAVRMFTVIDIVTMKPMTNNTWNCYLPTGSIEWHPITGLTNYEYQLDTIASFNSSYLKTDTVSSTITKYNFSAALYPNVTHYIRVRAIHNQDHSLWSTPSTFTICNAMPNAPKLFEPADMATNQPLNIYLNWIPLQNVNSYIVEYATDNLFSNAISIAFQPGTSNIYTAANSIVYVSNLSDSTTYFWRVRAIANNVPSLWSEVWSFTTNTDTSTSLTVPVLTAPLQAATMVAPATQLKWQSNGTSYLIEIDTDSNMGNPDSLTATTTEKNIVDLLFNTTYFWRVKAMNATDTSSWSNIGQFTTIEKPMLALPINMAEGIALNEIISWNIINGANNYHVQIDTSIQFNSTLLTDSILNATQIALDINLYNTEYFWRVKTMHSADTSNWSMERSFFTIDTMPAFPILTSPLNATTDMQPEVKIKWTYVIGASSYMVELDTNMLFTSADTLFETVNYIDLSDLLFNTTYFWRVKAIGAQDTSAWSNYYSFTILSAPFLNTPVDNSFDQMVNVELKWEGILGATSYMIELDTNILFSNPLAEEVYDNFFNTHELQFNTTYFWRVLAITQADTSDFSTVNSFTTINQTMPISPANGDVTALSNVLIWDLLDGVTGYICQVDTTMVFSSPLLKTMHIDTDIPLVQAFTTATLFGQDYYWRVRAIHNTDTSEWSMAAHFVTKNYMALALPYNFAIDIMPNPTLYANHIQGVNSYQLELDTTPTFDSYLYTLSFPSANTPYVGSNNNELYFGTTYYWRARARFASNFSNWSPTWSFKTVENVKLSTPVNGASISTASTSLKWLSINGLTHYTVELDTVNTFVNAIEYIVNSPTSELTIPAGILIPGKTYYWRVKAVHAMDMSDWSEVRSFNYTYSVGIADNTVTNGIDMYPNPTKGIVNIVINSNENASSNLQILDITGRIVYEEQLSLKIGQQVKSINLSNLSQGIYLVQLKTEKLNFNKKLILNN